MDRDVLLSNNKGTLLAAKKIGSCERSHDQIAGFEILVNCGIFSQISFTCSLHEPTCVIKSNNCSECFYGCPVKVLRDRNFSKSWAAFTNLIRNQK
jgi:hypothetical protein